jgi:hypothetical protein
VLAAAVSAQGASPKKPATPRIVVENRSAERIGSIGLFSVRKLPNGRPRIIRSNDFLVTQNGEKVHAFLLESGTAGVLGLGGKTVRPECAFEVDIGVVSTGHEGFPTVYDVHQDLCQNPRIVLNEDQIHWTYAPVIAPPPAPKPPPPSPPLTAPDSNAWAYIVKDKQGATDYIDGDSIVGDALTRSATAKIVAPEGKIIVARLRVRCDRWLFAVLSEITFDADGAQTGSIDYVAAGDAPEHGIEGDTIADAVAKRICRP